MIIKDQIFEPPYPQAMARHFQISISSDQQPPAATDHQEAYQCWPPSWVLIVRKRGGQRWGHVIRLWFASHNNQLAWYKTVPAPSHWQEQKEWLIIGRDRKVCAFSALVHPCFNAAVWREICSLIIQTEVASNLQEEQLVQPSEYLSSPKKQTARHLLWTQLSSPTTPIFSDILLQWIHFLSLSWVMSTAFLQILSSN